MFSLFFIHELNDVHISFMNATTTKCTHDHEKRQKLHGLNK